MLGFIADICFIPAALFFTICMIIGGVVVGLHHLMEYITGNRVSRDESAAAYNMEQAQERLRQRLANGEQPEIDGSQ